MKKTSLRVSELVFDYHQRQVLESLANLYCRIWKEPPWNERFWSKEKVLTDLAFELTLPQAHCFVAMSNQGKIVGFTWGYAVSRSLMRTIADSHHLDYVFRPNCLVYYIDELGVAKAYRKRGIAKKLTQQLICAARKNGCNIITLRTDTQAEAARKLYEKLGFKESPIKDKKYPTRTYWIKKI